MPVFQGINRIQPGYYSFIDTSGLVNVGILSGGTLAILGPAQGGVPMVVQPFTSPDNARQVFRGGDLLNAIDYAFDEGASLVLALRTGTPGTTVTQSAIGITAQSPSTDILTLTSLDYGGYTTGIQVKVDTGTSSGYKVTVQFVDTLLGFTTTEVYDNQASFAAIEASINATQGGSHLVSAAITGSGNPNTDVPTTFPFTFLTGGLDDLSPSMTEWTNAITVFNQQTVNLMNLAGVTDPTLYALLEASINSQANLRKPRMGFVGSAIGLPVGTASNASSYLGQAFNLNNGRMVYCAPGVTGPTDTTGQSGAELAARVAGWLSGRDSSVAITHQNLDLTSIEVQFDDPEKDNLLVGGVLFVEEVPTGRRVVRSITTAQDIVPGVVEDPFKEISVRREVDLVDTTMRANIEGKYVGQNSLTKNINSIVSDATALLADFQETGDITGFKAVTAFPDPNNPSIVYLNYALAPTRPINWIFNTTKLVNVV